MLIPEALGGKIKSLVPHMAYLPAVLDGMTLLLKLPHMLITEHGVVQDILPFWLVLKDAV